MTTPLLARAAGPRQLFSEGLEPGLSFRCRVNSVRTRATTITGWLRPPPWAASAAPGSSATRGRERSAFPVGRFLPWEGLEGGPLVSPGGL